MSFTAPAPSALIAVRNCKSGPTVFRDMPSDTTIRWEGRGDMNGQDVQYVPEHLKLHPQFAKSLRLGLFEEISLEQASGAFAGQDAYSPGSVLEQQAAASIDRPMMNDIIAVPCIGPGERQGTSCRNTANIRQAEQKTRPPLCEGHAHLAPSYVPMEGIGGDGLGTIQWVQAVMTAPVTEQQYVGAPPVA